ncbi:MAG TPA: low affinity iron permease family protein [Chitinophagaceae bacterium]|nr:low affinity iron permease family protein [Chitinophagaceae bacterium]
MRIIYKTLETTFEKFSVVATRILGNSITFILALILVIAYFTDEKVYTRPRYLIIMDVIFTVTFLNIFIIQKSVNRFSAALHLKMNELVASHDNASNRIINIEEKSEEEIRDLAKHYSTMAEKTKTSESMQSSHSIEHMIDEAKKIEKEEKKNN